MSIVLFGKTPAQRAIALIRGQFAAGQKGLWWESSPFSSLWQDSAGTTPVTAVDDPVGKDLDKSGLGNHGLQATAGSRPLLKDTGGFYSLLFDGVDDGIATAAFAAGTLTSNMDCFIAIKRNSAANGIISSSLLSAGIGAGIFDAAGGAAVAYIGTVGTPTFAVNGASVPGGTVTTRVQLDAALTVGSWLIVEMRNLDLSTWDRVGISNYAGGGFKMDANAFGTILLPAQTDANRATIRKYLGSKVGLVL